MEHVRILPAPPAAPNNGPLRATTLMCVATLTVVAVLVRWGVTPSGHWIANQAPTAAARPLTHAATRPVQSAPGVRSAPHRSRYATGPRQGPQSSALPPLRAAGGPEVAAAAYGLVPGLFGVLLLGVAAAAALLHKSQCRPRALAVTAQSTATPDSPDGEKHSPFESDPELPAHAEGSSSELTRANVERVLDEVRPYLIADGGNVELVDIVDKTVRLQLQGACGSCPASTTTMSMGIKRRLKEEIPSIEEVEEIASEKDPGLPLTAESVEKVLADIRPYLEGAGGGEVGLHAIDSGIVKVKLEGPVKGIMTIRVAITQKLRENIPDILAVQIV